MQQSQRHSVYICEMENDFVNHVKQLQISFMGPHRKRIMHYCVNLF